jgi:hypothetical protein
VAVVMKVLGQEYRRHSAPAQLALDPVAAGEGLLHAVQWRGHGLASESLLHPI